MPFIVRTILLCFLLGAQMWVSNSYAADTYALRNSGIHIENKDLKAGQTVKIHSSLLAVKAVSNVTLKYEIRQISSAGTLSPAIVAKSFTGLNFSVNEKKLYVLDYVIPSSAATGRYILAINVVSANGADNHLRVESILPNNLNLMQVTGSVTAPAPSPSPSPVPAPPSSGTVTNFIRNSAVYIPIDAVKAGNSIKIHNGLLATKALSNVSLLFEIRQISASGSLSKAVVSKSFSGVNFAANEKKAYALDYQIPGDAPSGKYIFAVTAYSGTTTHLSVMSILPKDLNVINISGTATTPTPSPTPAPSPSPTPSPSPAPTPVTGSYLRGINIMDLGISKELVPGIYGKDYTKPSLLAIRSLKDRGIQVIRIPFLWERLQYTWGGSLNQAYLGYIMEVLRDSNSVGMQVILDMHNYTRYRRNGVELKFSDASGPSAAQYADVWKKLVQEIRKDAAAYSAVYAFDIMNEPYGLSAGKGYATPEKLWEAYAQAAVDAIRSTGERKMIHIEGYDYSSALLWPQNHPAPFIRDSANNIMYHAHMYMDNRAAGTYEYSHAQEVAFSKAQGHSSIAARGIYRLKQFANWCAKHNVRCFLGEFGWPTAARVGSSDARAWNQEGEELMKYMDSIRMGGTMWATGSWLGANGNVMNTYVLPKPGQSITPLSQSEVLERHMGK